MLMLCWPKMKREKRDSVSFIKDEKAGDVFIPKKGKAVANAPSPMRVEMRH